MRNLYLPFIQLSKKSFKALLSGVVLALSPLVAQSQIEITSVNGYVYKQDFNSLPQANATFPNTALPGWQLGNGSSVTLVADDGTLDKSDLYNYGSTGSSDRSIGYLASGSNETNLQLAMKNVTASAVKYFKVSYRVEVWRKTQGNTSLVTFGFSTSGTDFTQVGELTIDPYISDNGGAINGDIKYVEKSFIIRNAQVASNGTIYFNWNLKSKWGISIDNVVIEPVNVIDYYNNTGGDLSSLSTWQANFQGKTIQPIDFTSADQVFHIVNPTSGSNTVAFPNSWTVAGTNSKVILGNGTTPIVMTISGVQKLISTIDLLDMATLVINTQDVPNFGQLSSGSTVVFDKSAPSNILGGAEFGRVVINTSSTNKFGQKIKIKDQLELKDSKLELGDNDLELGSGALVIGASKQNFIVVNGRGRVRKELRAGEEVMLPVGNITYNPVKIKLDPASVTDVFSVGIIEGIYGSYTNDSPDQTKAFKNNMVNKTWVVSEDTKGNSNLSLTLTWSATDTLPGFNPQNCYIKHYENGVWDETTPAPALYDQTTQTYSITRTGITSFSPFGLASTKQSAPLPVELVAFTAKATASTVELTWATASEINNDFFTVERSTDGKNFIQVGMVKGNGTSNVPIDYSFSDNAPLPSVSYYRLRQVDFDGKHEYSAVRAVNVKSSKTFSWTLYPNPTQGTDVNIQMLGLTQGEKATVTITDITGRNVLQRTLTPDGPDTLATSELKAGTYLVTVNSKAGAATQRLIIR